MEKKTIRVADAIKKGYTHCGSEDDDSARLIENLRPEQIESGRFVVCDEPYPYQIADDLISSLVIEHLESQDTVADEDGMLVELAGGVDYDAITKAVNDALSARLFYPRGTLFIIP